MAFSVSVDLLDSCAVIPKVKGGASTALVPGTGMWRSVGVWVIDYQNTLLLVIAALEQDTVQPVCSLQPTAAGCVQHWNIRSV